MKVFERKDFTEDQFTYLANMPIYNAPVSNKRVLNKLQRLGVCKLHAHTGAAVTWYGNVVKSWYVDSCECFQVRGIDGYFGQRYVDGCFYPYVVRYNDNIRLG